MPTEKKRLAVEKVHLTYKTHIDYEHWKTTVLPTWGNHKLYSFVHENGDEHEGKSDCDPTAGDREEETSTEPYAHTHIFIWMRKRFDTINMRFFDINDADGQPIHPNITNNRGIKWAKLICLRYHLGHKTKKDGKPYYIEPVFLAQDGVDEWKFEVDTFHAAIAAPSLMDACIELGIGIKSVSDAKTIRAEGKKRTFDELDDGLDRSKFFILTDDDQDMWPKDENNHPLTLIAKGRSGIGKTNWAIAQFKKPFKIEQIDELKYIPEGTDGIIFDEVLVSHLTKCDMIALTTWPQPRSVWCRNANARIPKHIKKIFCCNEHENPFGEDPAKGAHESVLRRIHTIHMTKDYIRSGIEVDPNVELF